MHTVKGGNSEVVCKFSTDSVDEIPLGSKNILGIPGTNPSVVTPTPKLMVAQTSEVPEDLTEVEILPPQGANVHDLDQLCFLQQAHGYWDLTNSLCSILHFENGRVLSSMPESLFSNELKSSPVLCRRVWATSLALASLRTRHSADRLKWGLIETKGKTYILQRVKESSLIIKLEECASLFIQ